MAFNIFIRPEAEKDIEQIVLWHQDKSYEIGNDLDKKFLTALESKLDKLSEIADSFAISYKNTRKVLLSRFPYAVHYTIENNTVIVFALLHTSQNPINWQERADNI